MSNLVVINGSPKKSNSATSVIIGEMEKLLNTKLETYQAVEILQSVDRLERVNKIIEADVMLIVFPLYVDAIPAPLLKLMLLLENARKSLPPLSTRVYAICHCGFYEAEQNKVALKIVQNFCNRLKLKWQYGVGIGAGVFVTSTKDMSHGPNHSIFETLGTLANAIQQHGEHEEAVQPNIFMSPKIPRFVYKTGGNLGWKREARENKVKRKLYARPYVE